MEFAGIQPYAYVGNDLHLLLGQEIDGLWSNFAGEVEGEKYFEDAAAREGYEETMGVLGSEEDIFNMIQESIEVVYENGVIYAFEIPFSMNILWYFQNFYEYAKKAQIQPPKGFFEKQSISWVKADEINDAKRPYGKTYGKAYGKAYRTCFLNSLPELISRINKENFA